MRNNYSAEELSNIARLKELREALNLNFYDISSLIGVDWSWLKRIEQGKILPSPKSYNKLASVFGWNTINVPPTHYQAPKTQKPIRSPAPTPDFIIGHVYSIKDTGGGKRYDMHVFDIECLFRFEGKQGELLRFTEIHGGWTLTYAPYQLIGKKIKEVN